MLRTISYLIVHYQRFGLEVYGVETKSAILRNIEGKKAAYVAKKPLYTSLTYTVVTNLGNTICVACDKPVPRLINEQPD